MTAPGAAQTPMTITNRPALRRIDYRLGTYATFLRAMLASVSPFVDTSLGTDGARRPLQDLTTRSPDDYGIAFLEMWAYLADVLTFYQERIANEALLRTATQPESVTYLVSLLGYRPAPGRAATAHLAFEVGERATVRLSTGLPVQSVPGQDEAPQKFETVEDLEAHGSLNVLLPRTTQPQVLPRGARRAVVAGVAHNLAPGDWVAIVGDERREDPNSERWDLRRLDAVSEDPQARTTTLTWADGLGRGRRPGRPPVEPASEPEVWVFRRQAWPFGHNAPDWRLLAASPAFVKRGADGTPLADPDGDPQAPQGAVKYLYDDWNDKHLPEDDEQPHHLYLDTVHPDVLVGGWVGLVAAEVDAERHRSLAAYERYLELYPILGVADTSRLNYTLTAKVTRLTVDVDASGKPENIDVFGMRSTVVLVASERLPLADVPLGHSPAAVTREPPPPVAGDVLELDADYADLHRERRLLVAGPRADGLGETAEAVEVAAVTHGERTTVRLVAPLRHAYERSSVRIYGNVATATHGETTTGEILGDGDASQTFQAFALRKKPVTHVSQAGAPGGVTSTVEVRVAGVRWTEALELHDRRPEERVYTIRRQPDDTLSVRFGDGATGARLVSGRANVEATYRVGLGPEGNVGAHTLRTPLAKPLGLKAVSNPAPAAGGAAAEDPGSAKDTAPGTVRTFSRIVSLRDFEDAAREYVGVAKARATWRWDGEQRVVDLVVAGDGGAPIEPVVGALRADLDARRDPHQPLRLRDFTAMRVSVTLAVVVDQAHVLERVEEAAAAALRQVFAFAALGLGQSVHLSDVYRAVQQVAGVVAVRADEFRFRDAATRAARGGEAAVQPHLLVAPDELAWVADPDDVRVTSARHARGMPS